MLPFSTLRAGRSSFVGFSGRSSTLSSKPSTPAGPSRGSPSPPSSPSLPCATMQPDAVPSELVTDAAAATDFSGALPKAEIQATEFLEKHPAYDGTGVIIAIFDTGVDPGAAGLQSTPDGRPKIVDVVDCTGSGDVDTSTVVTADAEGYITGLLGRRLRVNPGWSNPTGEWRVGARPAFELFPGPLKSRVKEERKKKFDERQRQATTAATAALAAHEAAHGRSPSSPDETKRREELAARVKLLEEMAGKYEDVGPMVETVVWHDGGKWLAALDTSDFYDTAAAGSTSSADSAENPGALAAFEPLTNFRDCHRHGTFSAADACNFALNIYDNGATLSVVVDAGSHGTHVAGIAAAYHPNDPSLNGIAPGAQIVSCKIGDTRLGSMETMVGLTRALIAALDNGVDLINMSYGEATSTPNGGRFIRLAEEIVHKHGIVYVASAGNAGPALTTVGAPGGTSSAILGVGAFVTPDLAAAGHSLREALASGLQYNWSSRGPTADGDTGVTFSAPGGAIASVPQWSQQRMQLMNGTSMASPCACGGLALLLSALKAEGQPTDPARIRRAVENTALALGDDPASILTYGRGLLQVKDAHAYLQQGEGSRLDDALPDLRLEVTARRSDGATTGRGVYLRDPGDASRPTTWSVEVKPALCEGADVRTAKLEIDLKLRLVTTAPWVKAPAQLLLHHNGRSFEVEIDPTALPEGLHYAEVQGWDTTAEWRGPLWRLPITVIRPLSLASAPGSVLALSTDTADTVSTPLATPTVDLGRLEFGPGKEERRFVGVPHGATWAELKIRSLAGDTPKSFMVRATAIRPHTRYSDSEHRSFVQLPPAGESTATFAVAGGTTLEVTLAQFWSSLGEAELSAELAFHGVEVNAPNGLVLDGSGGAVKLIARAPLGREKVKPTAKLDVLRIPLRPTDASLAPLSAPRDVLPGGRTIHSLTLTYKLSLTEGGKVTPKLPLLNRYVYDSEIEAQMSFLKDDNGQLLGVSDIYPEAVKLTKGDYTITLTLRHEDPSVLDSFRALPLIAERKLESAVSVPVYATNGDAVRQKDAISKERPLYGGESAAYFVGPLPEDKLPKDATPGRTLAGTLALGVTAGNGKEAPGALALTYVVAPKNADPPAPAAPEKAEKPTLADAVRDAEVKFLAEMKVAEGDAEAAAAYDSLLSELLNKYPAHLPFLREPLKRQAGAPAAARKAEGAPRRLIAAADAVLAAVDQTELAVWAAAKCPEEGEGAAQRKKEMEERRAAVVEALAAKATALLDEAQENVKNEEFEGAWAQLRRWVDPAVDPAHAAMASRREQAAGRLALAVRALDKSATPEDKPAPKDVLERREELFKELGWGHWAAAERARRWRAFPAWR